MTTTMEDKLEEIPDDQGFKYSCPECGALNNWWPNSCYPCEAKGERQFDEEHDE